jgi:hypothetical protein
LISGREKEREGDEKENQNRKTNCTPQFSSRHRFPANLTGGTVHPSSSHWYHQMHDSTLFLLDLESPKTIKKRRRHLHSKSGPETCCRFVQFSSVTLSRLPTITTVDTLHQIAHNHLQMNLGTTILLNSSSFPGLAS